MKNWKVGELLSRPYAHRGLYDKESCPENSLPAFSKAIEEGYGIELDVQMSHDGQVVVFHDMSLERMTGEKGLVPQKSWPHLKKLTLLDSEERIPLFSEVLDLVDGQVPLLVEIKIQQHYKEAVYAIHDVLRHYEGPYCIESFNPLALYEYRKYNNRVWIGQLTMRYPNLKKRLFLSTPLSHMLSKPDFIACDIKTPLHRSLKWINDRYLKKPVLGWTVKDKKSYEEIKPMYDAVIFENWRP